jgi:hypothetical protein
MVACLSGRQDQRLTGTDKASRRMPRPDGQICGSGTQSREHRKAECQGYRPQRVPLSHGDLRHVSQGYRSWQLALVTTVVHTITDHAWSVEHHLTTIVPSEL